MGKVTDKYGLKSQAHGLDFKSALKVLKSTDWIRDKEKVKQGLSVK